MGTKKKNKQNVKSKGKVKILKQRQVKNLLNIQKKKEKKTKVKKSLENSIEIEPEFSSLNTKNPQHTTKKLNLQKSKNVLNPNKLQKLALILKNNSDTHTNTKKSTKNLSLREKMWQKLKAARFRYLNEEMYSKSSHDTQKLFESDPEAFKTYHEGYQQQVSHWPINPLNIIIEYLQKESKNWIVADFGCGDAQLAKSVPQKVHSFDLVALNSYVTVCDMAKTPLASQSIDCAVFCLSLMGTNLHEYLLEANRVLKIGAIMKIAEVESRFENVDDFVKSVEKCGFKLISKNFNYKIFYFFEFRKERTLINKKKLPIIKLNACLYKKR